MSTDNPAELTASDHPSKRQLAFELSIVAVLIAVAGWIDAVGFLRWHRIFVSFMSGNSTEAAVGLGSNAWRQAALSFGVISLFLFGVVCGELLQGLWWHGQARSAVLAAVILLLALCCSLFASGHERIALPVMAIAMGAQNASFRTVGRRQVAVTYVTGTIVALGRALAAALRGQRTWFGVISNLILWLAMVAGAIGGTTITRSAPDLAVAVPIAVLLAVLIAGHMVERRRSWPLP